MKKLVDFEISDIRIERLLDDSTILARFRILTEGQNKHNLPMTMDVIKEAAERSLRGKPIVATYSGWKGDLEGHNRPEDSDRIGYIIENQEFEYLDTPDGKALFALGLIWKRYAPLQVGSIYDGESHSKDVSMEGHIDSLINDDDPSEGVAKFSFLGICVLGDSYTPASENANVTLLTFSEMKIKYEAMFSVDYMTINNSKDASIKSSSWSNPGKKLYNPLLSKSNKTALLNEAYLIVDDDKVEDAPSEALHYPHHSIKNGELVVNETGLKAAFQRARQMGVASGKVLAHIRRHYKELGLTMDNFSTNFVKKEENKVKDKAMMGVTEEEEKKVDEKPTETGGKVETKPDSKGDDKGDEKPKEESKAPEKEEEEKEDFACKYLEASKRLEEYTAKFAVQEKELNSLRKYKASKEESEKNFAIEQTISEVSEYLPKEELEKFRAEAVDVEFSEVEAFKNKIKARSLDFAKTSESGIKRMTIPQNNEEKKDKWGW